MPDLFVQLRQLAEEGTPRGADAVLRAAQAAADGRGVHAAPRLTRRPQLALAAIALVVLVAIVLTITLVTRDGPDHRRHVDVVNPTPDPQSLHDLYDTGPATSPEPLFLVPDHVPNGMTLLRASGGDQPDLVEQRGGSTDVVRYQQWVELDASGRRATASFEVATRTPFSEADPFAPLRGGSSSPTTVRGHPGVVTPTGILAWLESPGRVVTVTSTALDEGGRQSIADGLQFGPDDEFTVTNPPAGFAEVGDGPGFASEGRNPRSLVYWDGGGRGFVVRIASGSEGPPGVNLLPGSGARLVEVRGHHAVSGPTLRFAGIVTDQSTLFLQGANEFVQWLEPGNTRVTVAAAGLTEAETLAVANSLHAVDHTGWDQLVAHEPGRGGAAAVPSTSGPPTFTGDEAQIADAFVRWLSASTVDEDVAAVEDGEHLRATFAANLALRPAAGSSGQVDAIRLVGSDRALVTFSILSPALPNQQGSAVKVGGHWLVSRATYCAIVGLGPNPCPAVTK